MSLLAISINGGIKTLGAYAGLAAVVIIALLVLLYFAQAREIRRLSEWVERDTARRLAPPVPPAPAPRPAVAAPQQGPPAGPGVPVVTTVEGARRVPIPAAAATSTPLPPVAPAPSSSPDATTLSGEVAASAAETAVTPPAQETAVQEPTAGPEPLLPPAPDGPAPLLPPAPVDAEPMLPPSPLVTAPPLPRLIADTVPGQAAGAVHELGGGLLIGRGKVASLRLSDPLASARHARIAKQGEQFVIEDLGSTNGTFVNGVLISAPVPLGEGDRVRLGESEFVFAIAAAGAPQTPRPAAVPLLAAAAPERTIELDPESAEPEPDREPEPQPSRHRRLRFGHAEAGEPAADLPRLPPLPEREGGDAPGHGRWIAVGAIVLALAAVAIAVVEIMPGTKPKPHHSATPPASGTAPSNGPTTTGSVGTAAPPPSSVTVAVFNGTTRSGLAGTVAAKLASDGYVKGAIANAAAQSTTTVGYGTGERAAALEVAHSLGLPASDVAPMTSTAAGAAGGAGVAVTVGGDYQG